ncbi:YxlC family protein [Cytobacillus gottheilii]|uniref:YxlC family protein n=1 Tax=Cytobacillus gottheilii TaxID=859144 RepID=UPI0009BB7942|nr:YxlC family protein [Cytobacillus gottheilii]
MENQNRQDEELKRIEDELVRGLSGLDNSIENEDRGLDWFERYTVHQIQHIKKKQHRDNWLFAFIGLTVLCFVLFTLYTSPEIFLLIQIAVFLLISIYGTFSSSLKRGGQS